MNISKTWQFIFLITLFLAILGFSIYSAVVLLPEPEPQFSNISEATQLPEPVSILLELELANSVISIVSTTPIAGNNPPLIVNNDPQYFLDQIYEGTVVETIALDFAQYDHLAEIESNPRTLLILSYHPGSQLLIREASGSGKSYNLPTENLIQATTATTVPEIPIEVETLDLSTSNEPILGSSTQTGDGYLDVVFISSNFSDRTQFDQMVEKLIQHLITFSPFDQYRSKIRVHKIFTTSSLDCYYRQSTANGQRNIYCSPHKAYSILSQTNWDAGVVIDNTPGERGGMAQNFQIINIGVGREPYLNTFVHEMGHVVGKLDDEYVVGYATGNEPLNNLRPNCALAGCSKWSNISGTQCIAGCMYPHAYRSTPTSLMSSVANGMQFNTVSKNTLISQLEVYTSLPPAPPAPIVKQWCFPIEIGDQKIKNTPHLQIVWSERDNIRQVYLSTDKNMKNPVTSDLEIAEVTSANHSPNPLNLKYFSVYAHRDFMTPDNKIAPQLKDSTKYYVQFWDSVQTSEVVEVTTDKCDSKGDFNLDGKINAQDIHQLINEYGVTGQPGFSRADYNQDGVVNLYDYNSLFEHYDLIWQDHPFDP